MSRLNEQSQLRFLDLNGFRASICCKTFNLCAYQVTKVGERTTRCHVPSQSGERYEVIVQATDPDLTPHDGFIARLFTDGYQCLGRGADKRARIRIQHVRTSETHKQPLIFSSIETTDDDDHTPILDPRKVGLIEVRVFWAREGPERERPAGRPYGIHGMSGDSRPMTFHEGAKKAGFNISSLGEAFRCERQSNIVSPYMIEGDPDAPVAIFQFYHQPIAMLQAAGIAPAPSSTQLAKKRPLAIVSPIAQAGSSKRPRTATPAKLNFRLRSEIAQCGPTGEHGPIVEVGARTEAGPSTQTGDGIHLQSPPPLAAVSHHEVNNSIRNELETGSDDLVIPGRSSHAEQQSQDVGAVVDEDDAKPPVGLASAEARPNAPLSVGTHARVRTNSAVQQAPDVHQDHPEDTKPYLPTVSGPSDSIIQQLQTVQAESSSTLNREAELKTRIAARRIRVQRLIEEEQLAIEEAELAALELRARQASQRRDGGGTREVVDLTTDD
ncbi:unnamed protein product [Peniophora sp. CBMAI 1063]|nr:unnamed protein product [Peniophora sp. CBMAI 1063]